MGELRRHGDPPFAIAVLHGGPGAAGEVAPVARRLSCGRGILEPWQAAATVDGQVEELVAVLRESAELPALLVGFSWGAWLGFLLAARHPDLVRKLILVGSGPFEAGYAAGIAETRLGRLPGPERDEASSLLSKLADPKPAASPADLARLGELFTGADAFDPIETGSAQIECRPEIFCSVWPEAEELRRSGRLLEHGKRIRCPVVAIHGDFDPHPADGVRLPLQSVVADLRWVPLADCGHRPWIERRARGEFFRVLNEESR
jgi:pimeloyl-ACP methyl ester carboxylesterase